MAEPKTRPRVGGVARYFNGIADPDRRRDARTISAMMRAVTGERPVMWGTSIVGFGAQDVATADGKVRPWPVIAFSVRANALTLYLMSGFRERRDLMASLGKFKTGKVCLYIKRLSDIHLPTLRRLIAESVRRTRSGR